MLRNTAAHNTVTQFEQTKLHDQ